MQKKILVIDDEKNIRETLQDILELKGYEVVIAPNGELGFQIANSIKPDLIICDVMMPGMAGWNVLEAVRKAEQLANTPFLLLTAKVEHTDIRRGMDLGADDYLTKPFTNDDLFRSVESRLFRREGIRQEIKAKLKNVRSQINYYSPHEFNTPLNGIIGGIELLKMMASDPADWSSEEMNEILEVMHMSGNRLHKTLNNNILYNQIQSAEEDPAQKKELTSGLTPHTKSIVHDAVISMAKACDRLQDLQLMLEDAPVQMSSFYLKKIMEELTENAFKFSKNGQPVVVEGEKIGETYQISIRDKGRGMSSCQVAEIGPFRQFERKKYEQQGVGLGLFLTQRLLELNGGNLEISSLPEKGTHILVSLISAT